MAEVRYRRVLLKISGEGFGGAGMGLDHASIVSIAEQCRDVSRLGVELAVVVGGGNFVRGEFVAQRGISRTTGDYMGMVATVINALALQDIMESMGCATRVQTAIPMPDVAEAYIRRRAIRHLEKGRVIILAAGTGNPYFTTDTAAALRAAEIGAEVLLKGTKVDGVYSADPVEDPEAKRYDTLSYMECLGKNLRVIDATAIALCRENSLPIVVFDLKIPGNIERVIRGESIGTLVCEGASNAGS